jgi:hypothetical protein
VSTAVGLAKRPSRSGVIEQKSLLDRGKLLALEEKAQIPVDKLIPLQSTEDISKRIYQDIENPASFTAKEVNSLEEVQLILDQLDPSLSSQDNIYQTDPSEVVRRGLVNPITNKVSALHTSYYQAMDKQSSKRTNQRTTPIKPRAHSSTTQLGMDPVPGPSGLERAIPEDPESPNPPTTRSQGGAKKITTKKPMPEKTTVQSEEALIERMDESPIPPPTLIAESEEDNIRSLPLPQMESVLEPATTTKSMDIAEMKRVLTMLTDSVSQMERNNRKLVSDVQEILRRQTASLEVIKELSIKLTSIENKIQNIPSAAFRDIGTAASAQPYHQLSKQEQESRAQTRTYYESQLAHLNLQTLTSPLLEDMWSVSKQLRLTAFKAKFLGTEITNAIRKVLLPTQTMYPNDYRLVDAKISAYLKSNGKPKQQSDARMPPSIGGIPSVITGYGTVVPSTTPMRPASSQAQELPGFSFFSYTGGQRNK